MEPGSLAYQSGTLTTILECFLCLCEAIIEPYSCLDDSVHFMEFIEFNTNLFILEKLESLVQEQQIYTHKCDNSLFRILFSNYWIALEVDGLMEQTTFSMY